MDGVGGLHGWRWIFLLEGLPSIFMGIATWFYLPDFPHSASFLTERERMIASQRLAENSQQLINDTSFNLRECFQTILHPRTWLFCLTYLALMVPIYSFSFFMPQLIHNLGFKSIQAQLLSSPPYLLTYIMTILWAYHSDRTRERPWHVFIPFACTSIGYFLLAKVVSGMYAKFVAMAFTLALAFCTSPPTLAWHTSTVYKMSNTVKATSTAMMVSIGNLSGIIAPFLYAAAKDKMSSKTANGNSTQEEFGHLMNASFGILGCFLVCCLRYYLSRTDISRNAEKRFAQTFPNKSPV